METNKRVFIEDINRKGVLCVRERNPDDDSSGYGALEFVLNDGTVFILNSEPFGQGQEEAGMWFDKNAYSDIALQDLKMILKLPEFRKIE